LTTIRRTQTNEGIDGVEKGIINANGTWQSILNWGKNEGLDDDQQTAFEVLAAKHVFPFSHEAIIKTANLLQLARINQDIQKLLCMFITGPAGAGKCKSRQGLLHSNRQTEILFVQSKSP
jgi:hypothetical protein